VNGVLNVTSGALMTGFFVSEIANSGIVVGPFPLYEIDVDKIANTGVKAVLNLMTPEEIEARGMD